MVSCKNSFPAEESHELVKAACQFANGRMLPLLEAFVKETGGVRAAVDIEYIHRMRVASRRLRAALPLFSSCFPKKNYDLWSIELRMITRTLGEARDTDVQIAYLTKYQKLTEKTWSERTPIPSGDPPTTPAVRYLITHLKKRRGHLQKDVLSALDSLEKSRAVETMRDAFSRPHLPLRGGQQKGCVYSIASVAALRIAEQLERLLAFEPWVSHPEAVAEHHAIRIAAKTLRYTLEMYAPIYRLNLKKPIARIKKMQEILGDLHDCDVWIDAIIRLLLRERSFLRSDDEEKRPDIRILSSLKIFLIEKERERQQLYRHFVRYWATLNRTGFWDSLRTTLMTGRKINFRPHVTVSEADIRAAVGHIAGEFPGGLPHCRHVTQLSLMLFDGLQPFHRMGSQDRLLLECASMLHDIGWTGGRKAHNQRSATMIIADERLLLDIEERGTIALAAFAHRGSVPPESQPFYSLLSLVYQEKTLRIAGLLRIADGLDYLHQGKVQELHCVIGEELSCDVIATGDVSAEKERARIKSDLFARAFGRRLVIR